MLEIICFNAAKKSGKFKSARTIQNYRSTPSRPKAQKKSIFGCSNKKQNFCELAALSDLARDEDDLLFMIAVCSLILYMQCTKF
jgi:hypothetical protein